MFYSVGWQEKSRKGKQRGGYMHSKNFGVSENMERGKWRFAKDTNTRKKKTAQLYREKERTYGLLVGNFVGVTVGSDVGSGVGLFVVGTGVGNGVGLLVVGTGVGNGVGLFVVGTGVGNGVGLFVVGTGVGNGVGLFVVGTGVVESIVGVSVICLLPPVGPVTGGGVPIVLGDVDDVVAGVGG